MNSSDPVADSGKVAMAEFLLLDADMALLFVQRARNAANPTLAVRRLKAAAKAYDRIIDFIPRVSMTADQMARLENKLSALRSRLNMHPADLTQ